MSDMTSFRLDYALFETRMQEDGYDQAALDEVKQQVRDDWSDPEGKAFWIAYVKKEADFMRSLQTMARDITTRIKNNSRKVSI